MSLAKINSALVQAFNVGAFFSEANTQFENVMFLPPTNGTPWAALYFVPSQPTVATLGNGGTDRIDGFFQIDLNYSLNKGTSAANAKADAIRNAFTAGNRFTYSGQEVICSSCGRSQGRNVNGFYRVTITAFFYAYVIRTN